MCVWYNRQELGAAVQLNGLIKQMVVSDWPLRGYVRVAALGSFDWMSHFKRIR